MIDNILGGKGQFGIYLLSARPECITQIGLHVLSVVFAKRSIYIQTYIISTDADTDVYGGWRVGDARRVGQWDQ